MIPLPPLPKPARAAVARIADLIRKKKTFFLTGHERPDGDTVGSELALAGYLRGLGKEVTVANVGPVPLVFQFLPGSRRIRTAPRVKGHFDVAVVFECSGPERMGHIVDLKTQADCVINIDHHAHHGHFGHINLVDPGASSNSEQLCQIFARAKHRLTPAEATALYVGLVTDTGRFQQENTRPQSHWVAALLLEAGVDVADVSRRIYATRSPAALKLMSRALGSLRMELRDRVSVLRLTRTDFLETGAREDDTDDIVNQGLLPPSAVVSLFLREIEGKKEVKASLRGKGKVDLCRLAVSLGGGGHKNASGVTLAGSLGQAESQLLRALSLALG
ncbi:MAG: bifunctional oligoribonuclease/PAP phosphatase NrnA [Elusimicrobia bacterium]|nr:bifunctional oligoribonuclease/PAP phosphatase NrnA [Elusimicrobiota bacterium]MBP9128494.1 bifunctional oligoribonuclease/PAP phosphatase NrnA [Elusimicrobiota bacterium]MBP9698504.1 bifunctional oligoribonuclease/PAP phosphatase NrnA [Elusimicrobiota bacterium]